MESIRMFFLFLHKFVDFSEEEFNHIIRPYVLVRDFKKKQLITQAGTVENYINFIAKGLVRKYYKADGQEFVTQLATEGHVVHAQESFHSRTTSEYNVQAIEDCRLVSITYNDLERIYSTGAKMERLGRLVTIFSMIIKERWQRNMLQVAPRERFMEFVSKNPVLLQRVPQKYLASYLNIQPETFSRFKHMLKEKRPGLEHKQPEVEG